MTNKLRRKTSTYFNKFLVVKTSVLGGSVVTRQNLFTGGHLLFNGGAIAYYTVYSPDGTLLQSGVIPGESKNEKVNF